MIFLLFKDIKTICNLHKGRNTQCTRMAVDVGYYTIGRAVLGVAYSR